MRNSQKIGIIRYISNKCTYHFCTKFRFLRNCIRKNIALSIEIVSSIMLKNSTLKSYNK